MIGRLLMANKMRITVLERDISAVNLMRKYGYKVYYGDATQVNLLRSAGAEAAVSIVITCNEPEDTMKLVEMCRQHFPHLHILARARGRVEAHKFLPAGVTLFSRETFSSALELGEDAGHAWHASARAQRARLRCAAWICECCGVNPMHADTVQISRAREARRELEEISSVKCNKNDASWTAGIKRVEGKDGNAKTFIAGAKCPACQAQDSMAMWRENNIDLLNALSADARCEKQTKKPRSRSQR